MRVTDLHTRWTLVLAAVGILAACSDSTLDPEIDCAVFVGQIYIQLQPEPTGSFVDYEVFVGDSIQIGASLRRVDTARPWFNVQQGWSCVTESSSPVSGAVTFATTDDQLVRLLPGGWVRGLSSGLASITASSTNPAATTELSVLVYSP